MKLIINLLFHLCHFNTRINRINRIKCIIIKKCLPNYQAKANKCANFAGTVVESSSVGTQARHFKRNHPTFLICCEYIKMGILSGIGLSLLLTGCCLCARAQSVLAENDMQIWQCQIRNNLRNKQIDAKRRNMWRSEALARQTMSAKNK